MLLIKMYIFLICLWIGWLNLFLIECKVPNALLLHNALLKLSNVINYSWSYVLTTCLELSQKKKKKLSTWNMFLFVHCENCACDYRVLAISWMSSKMVSMLQLPACRLVSIGFKYVCSWNWQNLLDALFLNFLVY